MKDQDTAAIKKKMQKNDGIFTDSVDGLLPEDVKKQILLYSQHQYDADMALKNDDEINSLSEQLAEMKAPYMEVLKKLKSKIQYLHIILKEKTEE
jgi:hypothetical protein